ncbi:MAG: selenocysteine-specific translation elongation factor [Calditrichia bacterium]
MTGINTDRLKEEQERGITIDLGFAHLAENVTIIDVPGHERLIKNMVAGVSTIDLVLFVVAADDGIMPQTREHLDIVKLLGIRNGVFVITKIDLVDQDWLDLVEEELRDFLTRNGFGQAPILKTSVTTGEGIKELKQMLADKLSEVSARRDDGIFRMPIDRVFNMAGFGTVITGSVLSGSIQSGAVVEILPDKLSVRIRGIQSHDHPVEAVQAGYRAALNVTGVNQNSLHRGQVVTLPGYYQPVEIFNARFSVLPSSPVEVRNQMRLRIHLHTTEVFARVLLPEVPRLKPGESEYVQFRLEKPVYASFGDRFVIRQYSPQITIGGGVVLLVNPPKYRKKIREEFYSQLSGLESENKRERILAVFSPTTMKPFTLPELQILSGTSRDEVQTMLKELEAEGEIVGLKRGNQRFYFSKGQMETVLGRIQRILENYHQNYPGRSGMPRAELISQVGRLYPEDVVELALSVGIGRGVLKSSNNTVALGKFQSRLSSMDMAQLNKLEEIYRSAQFNPPTMKEAIEQTGISEKNFREFTAILREQGSLVLIEEKFYFHREAIREATRLLKEFFSRNTELRVPQFKDLIGTTRKYAIPLLTYFDNQGLSERQGDVRIPGPGLTPADSD